MSTPEGKKQQDHSRYDQMSTAELEQLLCLDFQASDGREPDLDTILYISDLLAKRNETSDPDAAWERFQTQYRPYADGRSLFDFEDEEGALEPARSAPTKIKSRPVRRLQRLATLAAALIACLLGGIVAAQAVGVDVWGAFARWTDESFFFVEPESETPAGPQANRSTMEDLQVSLQPYGMEDYFPTWIPDGFTPGNLQITELNASVTAHLTFFRGDIIYGVTVQHFTRPDHSLGTFEKDNTPVEEYVHNNQVFYILSNIDTLTAAAYDGEFMTMIYGTLTREEIKAIIDSIPSTLPAGEETELRSLPSWEELPLLFPQIPEGFVGRQSNFHIDPLDNTVFWSKLYTRDEQDLIVGATQHTGPSDSIYEKDDTPVETYTYHDVTHYIFSNNDSTTATWTIGNIEYYIFATDGAVDMKALIRSIYTA